MKASELLFLVVLASVPIQLGKFFFLEHSYVLGIPIDYRAVSIYFSDIATLLFIAFAIFENSNNLKKIVLRIKYYFFTLFALNIYMLLTSQLFSTGKAASIIFTAKFAVLSLLSILAADFISKKNVQKKALFVLAISVFWQSILIIAQFTRQGSLGLQILGERTFDSSTVQIAASSLFGTSLLRPYGTFPHPNVAAAALTLGLIVLISNSKRKISSTKILNVLIATFAIALTFSKSAFAVLALASLSAIKSIKRQLILLCLGSIVGFLLILQVSKYQIASIAERLLLMQASLDISLKNPIFGIGSNNFILELSKLDLTSLSQTRLLQPVHNVFLLILAENGITGLLLFALLLFAVASYIDSKTKAILFCALLIYLSIDHFLWTLHQGQLLFFLTTAYIVSKSKK